MVLIESCDSFENPEVNAPVHRETFSISQLWSERVVVGTNAATQPCSTITYFNLP